MLGMAYAGVPLYRIFCTVSAVLCFKLNYSKKDDIFKCLYGVFYIVSSL